jgi:hypothetical protein
MSFINYFRTFLLRYNGLDYTALYEMQHSDEQFEQAKKDLKVLPQILEAAFQHNAKRLESISIGAIRTLRTAFPDVAKEMSAVLVSHQAGTLSLFSLTVS